MAASRAEAFELLRRKPIKVHPPFTPGLRHHDADNQLNPREIQQRIHNRADHQPPEHPRERSPVSEAKHQHAVQNSLDILHRPALEPQQ